MDYRTTLGHKVNHKFDDEANTWFDVVKHPLFGVIVGLVASRIVKEDDEIFTNYNYDTEAGPEWYTEGYSLYRERRRERRRKTH